MTIQEILNQIPVWIKTGIPKNVKSYNIRTLLTWIAIRLDVQEVGRLKITKVSGHVDYNLEVGDKVTGIVEDTHIINAIYLGGNINLLSSYAVVNDPNYGSTNPTENDWASIADLKAGQANQTAGFNQKVIDASGDPNASPGSAIYFYKGNGTGQLTDYIRLSDASTASSNFLLKGNYPGTAEDLKADIDGIIIPEIVDLLTSTATDKTLSANQGRILKNFIDQINLLLTSDDTTLDELQEIVSFIKQNKEDLQNLSVENIAGLVAALESKQDTLGYTPANDAEVVKSVNGITPTDGNVVVSTSGTTASTEFLSINTNWQGGLTFEPYATWKYNGNLENDTRALVFTSDPSLDRKSTIIINLTTGQLEVNEGTPSANPVTPELPDYTTYLDTGIEINIPAGATEPAGVIGSPIYDENLGTAGGEWNVSGIGFDFANTESPASGTVAIKTTAPLANNAALGFTPSAPFAWTTGMEIAYKFNNITSGTHRWIITGNRSNGRPTNLFIDVLNYSNVSTAYQNLSIAIPASEIVEITYVRLIAGEAGLQYYVDDVRLITGGGAVVPGDYVTPAQLEAARLSAIAESKAYTDSLVVGGADNIHDSYDTLPLMIADQANQLYGEYFVVIDASGDDTVDAGWAMYEYLGTTLGTKDDYRKLSEEESMDVIHYDYSQDIADVQAEVDALEGRVFILEAQEEFTTAEKTKLAGLIKSESIAVNSSRLLAITDSGKKLCIGTAGVILTWPAGGLGANFEFNAVTNATGTLGLADQASGAELGGDGTFIPENSMGHAFVWPGTTALFTKGDLE